MQYQSLDQFPVPTPDNQGWPWTENPPSPSDKVPSAATWPKITIVTPSFNQGCFIEETIRSVIMQRYPNLEYIIIDGGSSDQSVEIIKRYEPWLTYWVSEKDRGQSHAINKGFTLATGDLVAWLNSDDTYTQGALFKVAELSIAHPESIILGDVENFLQDGSASSITRQRNVTLEHLLTPCKSSVEFQYLKVPKRVDWRWHQPGTFIPRKLIRKAGLLDESLHYAFDKDWIIRLIREGSVIYINEVVACFRAHQDAKTTAHFDEFVEECFLVNRRYLDEAIQIDKKYLIALYGIRLATIFLAQDREFRRFTNRRKGLAALLSAFVHHPRVLKEPVVRRLFLRALLPVQLWRSSPSK